jgi:hypothetical protein
MSLTQLKSWPASVQASLDRQYSRRAHLEVATKSTGDRPDGFAIFGGFRARHRYRALYLPAQVETRTRLLVHRPVTADDCRRLAERFGLVVFCGDAAPPSLESELLSVPLTVEMEMPTPAVFEGPGARWSRSAKANIAKVRQSGFTFDVVTGETWIADFYRRMFRPAMRRRHGPRAYVGSQRMLTEYARLDGAEFLRILDDGQWVAGAIGVATPRGYRLLKLGWLNGNDALLKRGIVSALYWFLLRRAAALGHRRIFLGTVEPYLEDSVLLYKSHWGGRLSRESRDLRGFQLLLDPSHPSCRRFLLAHSIVTRAPDRSVTVFSGRAPDAGHVSPDILSGIARWYQWQDAPLAVPEVTADDVPGPLRPWLSCVGLSSSS